LLFNPCFLVACLLLLSGCAPAYVLRLAYEEARILWRREPIAEMLRGDLDGQTREKLELTLAVREFARDDLGLSVDGSYSSVARVDADQIVHVVTAAPRDRLEPYTWWFPIAGSVPYRGYFDEAKAESLARELESEGYDTYVRPSIAFSTLGWFDDPLLSNLLRYDSLRLTEVILHELLHNTTYVAGSASFNESFATFVGWRGAVEFFTRRGDLDRARRAEAAWQDAITFSRSLGSVIAKLEEAYAHGAGVGDRTPLFDAARAELRAADWKTDEYQDVADRDLNNAVLVHFRLYADRLELFEEHWKAAGAALATTIRALGASAKKADDPFAVLAPTLVANAPLIPALSFCGARLPPENPSLPNSGESKGLGVHVPQARFSGPETPKG
jgi:predicted aminopeptidase